MKLEWGLGKQNGLPPAGDRLGIPESHPGHSWVFWVAMPIVLLLLYAGWRIFWFLTDDAYITFRYINNHLLGFGYTWNPPPFRPVEGYTSFSWLVLLEAVWRIFRVSPPESANGLSLVLAALTLGTGARMGVRMAGHRRGTRDGAPLILVALLGTVTNRTFLAWTSSGLETAMFNFLFTAWIFVMVFPSRKRGRWVFTAAATATLVYFTRPDGILVVLGTGLAFLIGRLSGSLTSRDLLSAVPGFAVPAHFIWRKLYYGAWLPNTYHAKQVAAWPESGVRYAASFILEYAIWVWLCLFLVWLVKRARDRPGPARRSTEPRSLRVPIGPAIAVAVLTGHFLYYTFMVGGDHFEYRVYSHLILLLFISGAWFADRIFRRRWPAVLCMVLFVLLSYPIPWAHWAETRGLESREETHVMIRPVADRFPQPLRGYARAFDWLQHWLITHRVCMRHQEHKIFHRHQLRIFPTREFGEKTPWTGHPVFAARTVGVPGWVLPNVAIVDLFGLNDYVVARSVARSHVGEERVMAHERFAPEEYLRCFRVNVEPVVPGGVKIHERQPPLTNEEIIRCERKWRSWADGEY